VGTLKEGVPAVFCVALLGRNTNADNRFEGGWLARQPGSLSSIIAEDRVERELRIRGR
jgi:hypothetical protein